MVNTYDNAWISEYALKDKAFEGLKKLWLAGGDPQASRRHINVVGPGESQQMFILAALLQLGTKAEGGLSPLPLLIAPDELRLRNIQAGLSAFWPGEIIVFPPREYSLASVDASSREQMRRRIACLAALRGGRRPVILTSPVPLLQPLPPPEVFDANLLKLELGQRLEPAELTAKLTAMGYEAVKLTETPGEFSARGDIVDIVPIDSPAPADIPESERLPLYGIRVSFFDDEIDQIRFFDITSQRQVTPVNPVLIPPAQEVLLSPDERRGLSAKIAAWTEEEAKRLYKEGASRERVQKMRMFAAADIERIDTGTDRGLIDRWLPLLRAEKTTLLDYAREAGMRPVVLETAEVSRRMDTWQANMAQQAAHLLERGQTSRIAAESFLSGAEVMRKLDREFSVLTFALIHQIGNGFPGGRRVDIMGREAEHYRGLEDQFLASLKNRQSKGEATFIFEADQMRRDRLQNALVAKAPGAVKKLIPQALAQGFEWPAAGILVLGGRDIFGSERRKRRRRKKQEGTPIDFFSDLVPGELVVHEAHGIGIYEGLENLVTNGSRREYIKVRYAGDDTLYLPIEALDQLRKYVGTDGRKPKLSRFGGAEWKRLKERARASIKALATDLVELYAKRSKLKGIAFPPDTIWDKEFAESFPYEETEDQLRCIKEIKEDMEKPRVMDRLLCGDVGFGKTEVAFRAMFKAVNGGMQAALLAPTTVLAQQHYLNFHQRVGEFPVRIGHLSRFASEAMQKRTIKGLASGEIDVVIGTHRLLSKDVRFKRLGLLVVDEEQRFGVDHKERIKELYPNVDVLTLSATPIPRTLHMSMSGIRDISVIEEPPSDRREIQTFVMEYDEAIIGDAIMREVSRGGQVFYLFNNVKKITEVAHRLEEHIPGLRVSVAHGQMNEQTLEDVISGFVEGEADVLVCTTIIESGIDMPNVNTLIVTNADRLGLAQIYQLKGRVGRSGRQAYAYITYQRDKVLREQAQKRLAAIREFTELGAGFKIALRDLEVRGAGNLLGAEQHGHMEAIGYDLYVRMLDEEVKRLLREQQEKAPGAAPQKSLSAVVQSGGAGADAGAGDTYLPPEPVETQIELRLDAYLPAELIEDEGQRMDMYRRLADIETLPDYFDILDELTDRYGDIPPAAFTLADISYVQARAGLMGISHIRCEKKNIILQFKPGARPNMQELAVLLSLPEYRGKIHFNAGVKAHLLWVNAAVPLQAVPEKLRRLFAEVEKQNSSAAESAKKG